MAPLVDKRNVPTLEIQLEELIAEIRSDVPQIDTWPTFSISMALTKAMRDPNNSVAKFQSRVLADESFGLLRNGSVGTTAYRTGLQDHTLPLGLIHACLRGNDPALVIDEARSFASRATSEQRIYYAVAGAKIDNPITFSPTLRLLPWSAVPESSTTRRLAPQLTGVPVYKLPSDEIVPMRADPGCAIEVDPKEPIRLLPNFPTVTQNEYLANFERQRRHSEQADDVVRCIFLISQEPTAIIAQWPSALDPAAQRHFGGSMSYGTALFEAPMAWPGDQPVESAALLNLWNRYSQLTSKHHEVMRHAIDRLNLAKRRPNILDRAIDLGIALEMLLLHGLQDKAELRFRLSLRGAHFIGGTKEKREETFRLLKRIYDLRSSAVHDGRFDKKQLEIASDIIEKGVALASQVCRTIIGNGSFPQDWESEYLLSVSSDPAH